MANYFDQFEEIKEDNKQKSYWEQFEPIEAEAEADEFDMDFQDPNKVTLGDRFNAVKDNLSKAIATTGQATMSNRPYVPNTSGALEGGVNYINDLASQVGNSINNAGQSVKNAYNTIANKPINLMPSRIMQPVSNAFSGVGRVASDVLPYAMGGYYNSPKDIMEATQQAYNYGVEEAKRDRQQQEMNPINLAESLVDMYTIGKFMPGNKATMLGRMGVAGKTGAVYGGLESLKHKGINPKENLKDAAVDAALFATLEPLAEIGFAAAKEGAKRLNPANYQRIIESVPKTSGSGLSQRTVYEPKVKYEYKPNVKNEYGMKEALNKPRIEANKMSDSTAFELGEASELKYGVTKPVKEAPKKTVVDYLAPNIAAKQQAKALEKAEKAESNYEQVMEEARKHTIKTGEQTRVTKNDNGMYEYEVVKSEVANVDAKIAELERKMKLVGGEKTQLGQKYKRQIEELRGTEQTVAPVAEEVKPVAEETVSAKLSDMLAPKQKKEQKPVKLNYVKQTRDGYALYENTKTKTMYMEKDGQFYDMKFRKVDKEFDIETAEPKEVKPVEPVEEIQVAETTEATKPAEAQEVVEKPKNVSKNTKIKVKKYDNILASDEFYSDGIYLVKKSKFTLEGKNTETKNLPNEQANMLWERYANNPTIELKPTNRTWEGKELKAVEYEYTDKNGDIQKIYLPKQNSDMFKGYDLAVSEYKASRYDEKFDIVLVKDGDEVVGFVSELSGRAKKNIVETPDNFVDTVKQKQEKAEQLKQAKEEKAGRPVIKYSVKVDKYDKANGLYMENDVLHTDGNSAFYNEFVMPDKTGVQRVTPFDNGALKTVNKMLETTANYTTKLEDIGKIAISKNPVRGQKIRVFEAEINGKKQQVFLNEKYLLDKKNLELYANDVEPQFNAISIRRNGEQIGVVMPITMKSIDNVELIDVPKMIEEAKAVDTRSDRKKAQDLTDYVYAVKTKSLDQIEKIKKEKGAIEAQDEAEGKLEFIEKKYKDYAKYMENNEKELTEEVIKKLKGYIIAKDTKAVQKPVEKVKKVAKTTEKTPKNTEKTTKTIEDSGEFLKGNRKEDKNGLSWEDLEGMNDLVRAKNLTKAKIYPKPSIDSLQEQGLDTFQSAIVQHIYNKIANKIPAGYETRLETQKEYTENIKNVMDSVIKYFKENPNKYSVAMTEGLRKDIFNVIYPDKDNIVGRYDSVFRKYPEYNRHAGIMGGNRFVAGIQIGTKELQEIRKIIEDYKEVKTTTSKVKKEDWEKTFIILEPDRWNNKYQVALAKSKRSFGNIVSDEFETREEAVEFARKLSEMQAQAKSALKKANFERDYIQRRDKDVSADELRDTFGFKGVNFGNYVTQKERQDFLNYTYDSLYDLAELLNLPPKALSLNGQLGIAFGAQGRGGKAAGHYIPDYHEINMTKDSGAGTLAHEWWHAFDNYFGSKAEGKEFTNRYGLELLKKGEIREEVYKAFAEIDKQMRTAPFTEEEIQKRKEAIIARCERNIKYYADEVKKTFRNVNGVAEYVDEVVANKDKYMNMSDEDLHNIEWKDFGKLIPEKRKTIQNMAKFSWLTSEIKRMGRAEEIAMKTPPKSQYLKDAERLNEIGGMGNDYWTKHTEMGARAFTTYLLDKMETQQIVNKFLTRSQEGEVSFDFKELAKELKDGEKRNFKVYWNPTNAEEKARIFKAFDKLFDTIKTRETEKGVELYSIDVPEFMKKAEEVDTGYKDLDLTPIYERISKGIKGAELAKILPKEIGDIIKNDAEKYTFGELINNNSNKKGVHSGKNATISLNLEALGNSPYAFIETLTHEIKHANQRKTYLKIMAKPKQSWTPEERIFVAKYNLCKKVNKERQIYYNKHKELIDKYAPNNFYSAEERAMAISQLKTKEKNILAEYGDKFNNYWNIDLEVGARAEGAQNAKGYRKESRYILSKNTGTKQTSNGIGKKRYLGSDSRHSSTEYSETEPEYKQRKQSVEQTVRDKVYDWHGGIGKDRYDVDKTLNSFIRMSKNIAKDISQKTGLKVSDKQLREMLPFLRERTNIPEKLDRDDLKKIFNALSGEEKARLVKFADDTSNKFEKYYKNYLDAKGEVDEASIENHISHIWDLDDKKQALLTNYITTKSKFAKQRTIETLAKGINGIEIDGKIVEFKPKTLDYAEILKSSSDNLIKATYDMQLAETIKGMKDANGKSLVLPAHKAPADWIEVSHPALNKAVYMGTVGEDELPMLMKSSVKVHPDLEKYVASIFETPKTSSKFWKAYDSINGILKQTQLGFSGFHGYALSESALANMGVKKTLDSLNVKKVYDAVKNGNYEIYEHEAEAKRAIDAGVQLGTPSDLNRNLVEETLNKIPVLGKYISGAVSVNNKILWDVLHNNFKLFTFNTKIAELEKAGKVTKEQERAVAQWVNDTYGGQSWELLGVKNSDVRKAGRVLLSPDWNFSTVRQALGSINNAKLDKVFNDTKAWKRVAELMGVSENIGGEGVRGKIARDFWIRAVVYSTIFYNAMNAAFRADDREKHPERYPKKMKPFDYSIWANANPMDNWYEKMMPYVFIGRNSDGTARMLRVGKQFREVPELAADPITKLSGKSASIIGLLTQVAVGMSPADIVKKVSGREAYLNQNIWEGYGEDARMRDGIEAVTGRLKVAAKGAAPFMLSKYIDGKHEPSAWDMFAQTSVGSTKGKVYKEAKEAFEAGREDKIREIKQKAYRDGVRKEDINKMVGYAEKNYKADNTKKYRKKFIEAMKNKDKKELNRIKSDMQRHHLSAKEQRRIYESAYKKYLQER